VSEHAHQAALISWWAIAHKAFGLPEYALLAIPNGGMRNKAVAGKLKAEGVRAGIVDLVLPVSRKGYHSLWIEMKQRQEQNDQRAARVYSVARGRGFKVRGLL